MKHHPTSDVDDVLEFLGVPRRRELALVHAGVARLRQGDLEGVALILLFHLNRISQRKRYTY